MGITVDNGKKQGKEENRSGAGGSGARAGAMVGAENRRSGTPGGGRSVDVDATARDGGGGGSGGTGKVRRTEKLREEELWRAVNGVQGFGA